MTETFTSCIDGRLYIDFLKFQSDKFPVFLRYLSEKLSVEMGSIKDLALAEVSDFRFDGHNYSAVSGHLDTCHVVALDEASRIALLKKIFGADLRDDLHKAESEQR